MAASTLLPFVGLCAAIFAFTYLFALVPLMLPLSSSTLRKLHLLGSGVLLGAAFTVVIPEGAGALYRGAIATTGLSAHQQPGAAATLQEGAQSGWAWSRMQTRGQPRRHIHEAEPEYDADAIFGYTLLAGFFVMFIIDQLSHPIRSPPSNRRATPPRRPEAHRMASSRSTSRGAEDIESQSVNAADQSSLDARREGSKSSTESPEVLPADYDRARDREEPPLGESSVDSESPLLRHHSGDAPRSRPVPSRSTSGNSGAGSTMLIGLLIHAAADGIAMGAGAASEDKSLRAVLVMAIMVHKAPAAIALCTLLIAQGMHRPNIRRSLAAFSASTPLGALATYLLLSVTLPNDLSILAEASPISPRHIGIALCFSGGTFLYVALHALQNAFGDDGDGRHHDDDNYGQSTNEQHGTSRQRLGGAAESDRRKYAESAFSPWLSRLVNIAIALAGAALPSLLQKLSGGHGH